MKTAVFTSLLLLLSFTSFGQRDDWYLLKEPGITSDIVQDKDGNFHCATYTGYVVLNSDLELTKHQHIFNSDLNNHKLTNIAINPVDESIFFTANGGDIITVNGEGFQDFNYDHPNPHPDFYDMWIASDGSLILEGDWTAQGLHVYNGSEWYDIPLVNVNSFVEDDSGNWLFSTASNGLQVFDPVNRTLENIQNAPFGDNIFVQALFWDPVISSLYISTSSSGIYERKSDGQYEHYSNNQISGAQNMLKDGDVLHLCHLGGGYTQLELSTKTFTNYSNHNSVLENNTFYHAFPLSDGVLLNPSGNAFHFQPELDATQAIRFNQDGAFFSNFQDFKVRVVNEVPEIFGSTWDDGLAYKKGDQPIQQFNTENSDLTSNNCNDLEIDEEGNIWLATDDGVFQINTEMQWSRYDTASHPTFFTTNDVQDIGVGLTTNNVPILITTGIDPASISACIGFTTNTHSTVQLTEEDGLPGDNITAIEGSGKLFAFGTSLGQVFKLAFTNAGSLAPILGEMPFTASEPGEISEIQILGLGLTPEYFPTHYLSLFGQVGLRLDFISAEENSNSFSDDPPVGFEQLQNLDLLSGSAGAFYYFGKPKRDLKTSHLFGYGSKTRDEPLVYYDINNPADSGSVTITDLNLKPWPYQMIATPVSSTKIGIFLNTADGFMYNTNFDIADPTGLDVVDGDSFSVFPNPVSDVLNIPSGLLQRVEIHDAQGRLVRRYSEGMTSLDVSDLNEGVYILTCGEQRCKFLKSGR